MADDSEGRPTPSTTSPLPPAAGQDSLDPRLTVAQATSAQVPPQIIVNMPGKKRSVVGTVVKVGVVLVLLVVAFFIIGRVTSTTPVTSGDTVAVIHMTGTISSSGSGYITPENFYAELSNAEDDPNVKAIVLRVNSGGGSSAASEEIATYVQQCTKPVVVSAGDTCASGAYMVASQADWVMGVQSSSVGSIGVISTITDYSDLLEALGIDVENITSGDVKGMGNGTTAITDEQRQILQNQIDEDYSMFIQLVADGRGMSYDDVKALATGATYTASDCVDNGLIDSTGTLQDAYVKAAELGGIEGDTYAKVSFDISNGSTSTSLLGTLLGLL